VKLAIAAPVLLIAVLAAGCRSAGKSDARAEARHSRPDSGFDAGTALVDPASGAPILLTGDRLPDGFPKIVPLYPAAKILGAMVTTIDGKRRCEVTLGTTDQTAQIDDFYRTHLKGFIPVRERSASGSGEGLERTLDAADAAVPLRVVVTSTKSGLGSSVQIITVEG
jgi:hypothetical protein